MASFTDQTGRRIEIIKHPQRIVSIVPSQTELLYDLGLEDEVVGITKFCIHPESWFRHKHRVGGTKQVSMEKIHALKPDLILANKEENVREQVAEMAMQYPVWISDINTLTNALDMIHSVGLLTGKQEKSAQISHKIRAEFAAIATSSIKRACYLIWQKPFMTVGGDTFIHEMMRYAGLENVFAHHMRYPIVSIEELKSQQPEVLLLSSEPYPFGEKQKQEWQSLLPGTKVVLVDGEYFSWYGSRLQYAPQYFKELHDLIA